MKCSECGEENYSRRFGKRTLEEMDKRKICFRCLFWLEKVDIRDEPGIARIQGIHYMIRAAPENIPDKLLGHGGRMFIIKFDDGMLRKTNNLWCQGYIPKNFRDRLPNNAVFVKEEE